MRKYKKGGFPADENLFICTSEKEIELVGTLDSKGVPHTSEQISKTIAESIREAVEKEVGTEWLNELIQQTSAYRP